MRRTARVTLWFASCLLVAAYPARAQVFAQPSWPQSPALRALEAPKTESKPTYLSCQGWAWNYPSGFGNKAVTSRADFVIKIDHDNHLIGFSPDATFNAEMPLQESEQWYMGTYSTNMLVGGKVVKTITIQVNRVNSRADVRYVLPDGHQYTWSAGPCYSALVQY